MEPTPSFYEQIQNNWPQILAVLVVLLAIVKRFVVLEKIKFYQEADVRWEEKLQEFGATINKEMDLKLEAVFRDISDIKNDNAAIKSMSLTISKIANKLNIS